MHPLPGPGGIAGVPGEDVAVPEGALPLFVQCRVHVIREVGSKEG